MNELLCAENLSKEYVNGRTRTPVLKNVNLSVSEGEIVAVLGESGSGKSTLLHLLGLLDSPTSGRIL